MPLPQWRGARRGRAGGASLPRHRALGTALLWTVFFADLLDIFLLQNWIPVISHSVGLSVQKAEVVGTLFQVGGVVAALLIGLVMDRYGSCRTLALLYAVGCVFAIVLGLVGSSEEALMILTFLVGFSIVGGRNAANALSAIFYPTAMRSTGVGWALRDRAHRRHRRSVGRCLPLVAALAGFLALLCRRGAALHRHARRHRPCPSLQGDLKGWPAP